MTTMRLCGCFFVFKFKRAWKMAYRQWQLAEISGCSVRRYKDDVTSAQLPTYRELHDRINVV
jgi:hypothetical protein